MQAPCDKRHPQTNDVRPTNDRLGVMNTHGMTTANAQPTAWALVIEDDPSDRRLTSETLRREGLSVIESETAGEAFRFIRSRPIDLVVLDLGLLDRSGLDVLVDLRRTHDMPVIIASGQADPETAVVGLRLGADDYIVKPFSPAMLAARAAAVLRRSAAGQPRTVLEFEGLRIDVAAREVKVLGEMVEMPSREFDLLAFLAANPRQVFTREQLLEHVWESSPEWQGLATVTEHIRKIRLRIEQDAARPRWITTVRRVGYRFNP